MKRLVPGVLLTEKRGGPWSALTVLPKPNARKRIAVVEHLDGTRCYEGTEKDAPIAVRIADCLNGWEAARDFPPDQPERWRMSGEPLPRDPDRALLERCRRAIYAASREGRMSVEDYRATARSILEALDRRLGPDAAYPTPTNEQPNAE